MNLLRFAGLPNALKPAILVALLLIMLLVKVAPLEKDASLSGEWYFWLSMLLQFLFITAVCALFLLEVENILTFGRDAWPVVEMGYSGVFFCVNVINIFVVASWRKSGKDGTFIIAALFLLLLDICYAFGGVLMFRVWKGFVRSGTSQNPTTNVQPGDVGNMHPGI